MDNNDRKQMIQKGFDTVATGYDHPSLPFFEQTASRLIEHLQLTPEQHLLDVHMLRQSKCFHQYFLKLSVD